MTRKQLPKAIRPAGSDLRAIAAQAESAQTNKEAQTPQGAAPAAQIEAQSEIWSPSPPPANDSLPAVSSFSQSLAERRLREAFKIVERHKMYAGLGGLLPLPAVNVAGVTGVNLRMVKSLSDLYGVPFERDKIRSIIIGLMGGAAPIGFAAAATSTLAFVPGAAALGLAVSSITAASLTRRIGVFFLERFEKDAVG